MHNYAAFVWDMAELVFAVNCCPVRPVQNIGPALQSSRMSFRGRQLIIPRIAFGPEELSPAERVSG